MRKDDEMKESQEVSIARLEEKVNSIMNLINSEIKPTLKDILNTVNAMSQKQNHFEDRLNATGQMVADNKAQLLTVIQRIDETIDPEIESLKRYRWLFGIIGVVLSILVTFIGLYLQWKGL